MGFRRALEACALLQRRNERANDGGRFDDGMPLMGFSGDTGKDNSTQ